MTAPVPPLPPAYRLTGLTLPRGWTVLDQITRPASSTGGHFSIGYRVRGADGRLAFLKALDFSSAFMTADPSRALQAMTEAYNFERDILSACRDGRLDRIVLAIDDGSVVVDPTHPMGVVQYLVFEMADGDVRAHMSRGAAFDVAWALRSLHHVATGLFQLHGRGIAHQDLKPSNVLVFGTEGSKLADLGRAAAKGQRSPHDALDVAGDMSYAPPELLYHQVPTDWNQRRSACDAYLLGSLVVFLFTKASMTGMLFSELPDPDMHWRAWTGTFKDVLPFLRGAFARAVSNFGAAVPTELRAELVAIVEQLCDPDPDLRGHPKNRRALGNQYSVERYIARLNLLATKAEFKLKRGP